VSADAEGPVLSHRREESVHRHVKVPGPDWSRIGNFRLGLGPGLGGFVSVPVSVSTASVSMPEFWSGLRSEAQIFGLSRFRGENFFVSISGGVESLISDSTV